MSIKNRRLDRNRLAAVASRPGIDTRVWLSLAVVTDVGFDPAEGIFADIRLLPGDEPECATVASSYAGNGYGAFAPLFEGDVVVVAVPHGDSANGPVIISRLWSSADIPPSDLAGTSARHGTNDPSPDPYLRVQANRTLKIRTSSTQGGVDVLVEGDGEVNIKANGSGTIKIEQAGTGNITLKVADGQLCYVGDSAGAEPIALGQTLQSFLASVKTWMDGHVHSYLPGPGAAAPTSTAALGLTGPSPTPPTVTATKGRVK